MAGFEVQFKGALGEDLSARLDTPENPVAYVLFAHCFTCSKDLSAVTRISKELNALNIAMFRFDFTGLGHSDGAFANTNFSSNVEDLIAAADHMREHYSAPHIVIGHSFGGTATLAAAGGIPEARAVATIGAPFEPAHVLHLFEQKQEVIARDGEACITLSGREFKIKKQFLDDLTAHNMEEHIKNLDKALLVFHSPIDETVEIDNAQKIFQAAKHPKSFVSLDDADHLLTRAKDDKYVAEVLAAWASRYID